MIILYNVFSRSEINVNSFTNNIIAIIILENLSIIGRSLWIELLSFEFPFLFYMKLSFYNMRGFSKGMPINI